ncbi:Sec-independent protein translocase protein TatB [Thalassobaculum sp. OXR-137]|uniref:Sec-independent protein translocase protein TatB n=1 Tax=Thalassobaculum sp. OXR-137 TaxID=3100173 RepID=UPI002AC9398F|nr:Sec-independent protein translocase protein TatB [Thalassobaculum sp. OXR-137]WPZ32980.1 Sec-independent protein translocase protein TatB [Thalassobaculum sp. OXR-137]
MFDLGWQEFILIAIITVIVVGPKDLPRVVRSISQWVRKARSMAREFQNSLEEVAREAELEDVRREMQSISKEGVGKSLEKQFDPDGSVRSTVEEARKSANTDEIEADLKALDSEAKSGMSKSSSAPAPAVETADDYAAKSVTAATPKPVPTSDPAAEPASPRPKADSAASGQG